MRTLLFISLLSFKLLSEAQSPLSFIQSERTDRLDPQITSQRSLVIISTPKKDDKWKTYARYVHKAFRVMGVDAVNYMHYLDYNASPVVKQANDSYASRRQIKFYIVIEEKGNAFRMAVQNQSSTTDEAWYSEADDLRQLILNLAVPSSKTVFLPTTKSLLFSTKSGNRVSSLCLILPIILFLEKPGGRGCCTSSAGCLNSVGFVLR